MEHAYSYEAAVAASERVNWRIEDVIGGEKPLDFSRPFLPETLARVEPFEFLRPGARAEMEKVAQDFCWPRDAM